VTITAILEYLVLEFVSDTRLETISLAWRIDT